MKRCPECGFRDQRDALRYCPLCGVKMTRGTATHLDTHVHSGEEQCLLPNQTEDKPVRPKKMLIPKKKEGRRPQTMEYAGVGAILAAYVLLRACAD